MKKGLLLIVLLMLFNACNTTKNIWDADLDGVSDVKDVCPKLAGSPFNLGCPADKVPSTTINEQQSNDDDLDGVLNDRDECPKLAGSPFSQGCP